MLIRVVELALLAPKVSVTDRAFSAENLHPISFFSLQTVTIFDKIDFVHKGIWDCLSG